MTPEQSELLTVAAKAATRAYAPYSKFSVGAAVLTENGIFPGANIENASANLGICAERVAIAHARMNGCNSIIGIAVSCVNAPVDGEGHIDPRLTMPCGACRQWMAELAPDAWLVTNGSDRVYTMLELLPQPFTLTS
jgi:cytidine deaminase